MEFKKKLKQRFWIAVSYIIIGLILCVCAYLTHFENYFLFSFGFALVLMGIIRVLQYRKITANEKTIRHRELTETDERNRMIAERARSWSFSISILVAGILVILLSLLGYHDLALPFSWFVCIMVCLYWICWMVIRKKY